METGGKGAGKSSSAGELGGRDLKSWRKQLVGKTR